MKKQLALLLLSSFLLVGCSKVEESSDNGNSSIDSSLVSPTCNINVTDGGSIEIFKDGKSYGKASSSSPLILNDVKIGDSFTIKVDVNEGYKTSIVTLNGSTIKGQNGYYVITIEKNENVINFSFKLIETDIEDFTYDLNEETKEATILSYSPDEIPTPVLVPSTITVKGVSYSVTKIASGAFDNCEATKINIPSSINNIEYGAFKNAYNMHYFSVDSDSNAYSAKDGVLFNKDGSEIVAFPARYQSDSYVMDNSVTSIAPYAFYCNRVISSLTLSSSLASIGEYCFYNANKMTELFFPSSLKKIADYAFYQNSELTTVNFSEGLEEMGQFAFYGLVKLRSLSFPKTLKVIRENAFFKCDRLSSITFQEGLEEIEALAFSNLTNVTKIVFPSTLKVIGKSAFSACSVLESVTFNEGLEEIDNYAFALCSSLNEINIPSTVSKIGFNPFYAILKLDESNFKISSENENYVIEDGVLYTSDMKTIVSYPYNRSETTYAIPSSVTKLDNFAFALNASLLEVSMPKSVMRIDESFYGVTSALHIIYEGTEEEFENIDKSGSTSYSWKEGAYSLYVTYSGSANE